MRSVRELDRTYAGRVRVLLAGALLLQSLLPSSASSFSCPASHFSRAIAAAAATAAAAAATTIAGVADTGTASLIPSHDCFEIFGYVRVKPFPCGTVNP